MRFIIKIACRRNRWAYICQICQMENYVVRKFQYHPNRDRAQRMGKLEAEMIRKNMVASGRYNPEWLVVEPEIL